MWNDSRPSRLFRRYLIVSCKGWHKLQAAGPSVLEKVKPSERLLPGLADDFCFEESPSERLGCRFQSRSCLRQQAIHSCESGSTVDGCRTLHLKLGAVGLSTSALWQRGSVVEPPKQQSLKTPLFNASAPTSPVFASETSSSQPGIYVGETRDPNRASRCLCARCGKRRCPFHSEIKLRTM